MVIIFLMRSRGVLFLLLAVLGLAVAATIKTALAEPEIHDGASSPPLMAALRAFRPVDWSVEELPLGDTERLREVVLKTLRYDDAVFLRYRRGGREFSVYVAFWGPNKATARDVRLHTPDTCWVQAGWVEKRRDEAFVIPGATGAACVGQLREYEHGGAAHQEVVFWHFMDGALVPHWRYGQPTVSQVLRAVAGDQGAVRGAQFFIRVSSPERLDWLWKDEAGRELLRVLEPAGLKSEQ